jgi:hypothetical protein
LQIRRVARYRKAAYPSRSRKAKPHRTLTERVVRAAAGPAVALGLGAGCDGGTQLVGDPDAADAVDTVDTVADATDVRPVEDAAADDWVEEDIPIFPGEYDPGTLVIRYLTEAEGRALIDDAVAGETVPGPAGFPPLAGRIQPDRPFRIVEPVPATEPGLNVDRLAPSIRVPVPGDPGADGLAPAVGFEFMTDEAGDDQEVSGDPDGLTRREESLLDGLRSERSAAIERLRSADYPYDVWVHEWDGWEDDSDKVNAENAVRETIRALLDDLRRDGFL